VQIDEFASESMIFVASSVGTASNSVRVETSLSVFTGKHAVLRMVDELLYRIDNVPAKTLWMSRRFEMGDWETKGWQA
jgi:hypothetical protein